MFVVATPVRPALQAARHQQRLAPARARVATCKAQQERAKDAMVANDDSNKRYWCVSTGIAGLGAHMKTVSAISPQLPLLGAPPAA